MKNRVLLVMDMLNDFIAPEGALYCDMDFHKPGDREF